MRRNARAPKDRRARPHPCGGHHGPDAQGGAVDRAAAGAHRRRLRRARGGGKPLPAVPARRLGHGAAISRHGRSRHRHAGRLEHAADLPLQSGGRAHRGALGPAERSDRQGRRGPPGSAIGHCDPADAGAGAGRRRAAPGHAQARPEGRADRLQRQWPQSRRPGARAVVGSGQRARRLHHGASHPGRRRRAAQVLLSRQPDRQSARHDHCGGRAGVRRRDRALPEDQVPDGARRRLRALPGRPLQARLAGAARAAGETEGAARRLASTACCSTPSCTASRRSSFSSRRAGPRACCSAATIPSTWARSSARGRCEALSIPEADKATILGGAAERLLALP